MTYAALSDADMELHSFNMSQGGSCGSVVLGLLSTENSQTKSIDAFDSSLESANFVRGHGVEPNEPANTIIQAKTIGSNMIGLWDDFFNQSTAAQGAILIDEGFHLKSNGIFIGPNFYQVNSDEMGTQQTHQLPAGANLKQPQWSEWFHGSTDAACGGAVP